MASEPSEPSEMRPEDKAKDQLRGEQEENPQLVAHRPGRQAGDRGGDKRAGGGEKGLERVNAENVFGGNGMRSRL